MRVEEGVIGIKMKFQLLITKADNGFILEWQDEDGEAIIDHEEVFEEKSNNEQELECVEDMLLRVKDYFGYAYSKHNEKNIIIKIEGKKEEEE